MQNICVRKSKRNFFPLIPRNNQEMCKICAYPILRYLLGNPTGLPRKNVDTSEKYSQLLLQN